jgi:plastocyanin
MLQRRSAVFSLAVLLLASAPAARAITVDVAVGAGGLVFSPKSVTIHVGDTVRWTSANGAGFHNVHADDDSFKCSTTCNAGSNDPASDWVATHTFNAAGTFAYYCEAHGGPNGVGMSGSVSVLPAGPQAQPGTLGLSPSSYTVSEAAGSVTVHVSRTGGADGAVSVNYAATAGSATAGSDFTATSGTLNWGDQDSADKTFQVAIVNDSATESNETINLTLSSAGGGATLGTSSGTITIQDDDSGPTAPAAPSNLAATGVSDSDIQLTWKDNSNNETAFRIESKTGSSSYSQVASPPANSTGATISGLQAATAYTFRVRAANGSANSAFSNEATASTQGDSTGPCVAGPHTLCLGDNGRFKVEVAWSSQGSGSGDANAVPLPGAPQSGLFYFIDPSNIEMLVKVLNACVPALGNHYWVFYAATTNVQFTLRVTDTKSGLSKTYTNALNHAADPVQDTNAFATCP